MAGTRSRRPVGVGMLDDIRDGSLCRAPSPRPGSAGWWPSGASMLYLAAPHLLVYCELWSRADREAFRRGLSGRLDDFADEADEILDWLEDSVGLGEDGEFEAAWIALGEGLSELALLGWKVGVVLGLPWPLRFHPQRDAFRKEIVELGLVMSRDFAQRYEDAHTAGGLPQCCGVVLADLLRLALEIAATKGAGRLASATKLARRLPTKLQGALPDLSSRTPATHGARLLATAQRIDLDPHGRPVALYFGISNASLIPARYSTLDRMLAGTGRGRRLLKQLDQVPWMQKERVWWELSHRASRIAGRSRLVHVYVPKSYYERCFPDPAKLKTWWQGHKQELIEIRRRRLSGGKLPAAEQARALDTYRKQLDGWSRDQVEAQHYAVLSKHPSSGRYEDQIFHKIEKLNLSGIQFHAIDDTGRELRTWSDDLSPDD